MTVLQWTYSFSWDEYKLFPILAILTNSTLNIHFYKSDTCAKISLMYYLWMEVPLHVQISRITPNSLPKWLYQFTFLQ